MQMMKPQSPIEVTNSTLSPSEYQPRPALATKKAAAAA
jgi:hypothetical protein